MCYQIEETIEKLQTIDLIFFVNKSYFCIDVSQNYLIFHLLFNLLKLTSPDYVKGVYWRSIG